MHLIANHSCRTRQAGLTSAAAASDDQLGPSDASNEPSVVCIPSLHTPASEPWWKGDDFLLQSDMTDMG